MMCCDTGYKVHDDVIDMVYGCNDVLVDVLQLNDEGLMTMVSFSCS